MNSMPVMRLTPGGRLDRTFGRNRTGFATTPAGGIAQSIVLQANGGILLGGSNEKGRPMVVARFGRGGVLDRRFGAEGLAQILFWNPIHALGSTISGLATVPGGGVIGFGHLDYIGHGGYGSAGVFRLSASGRLVRGFGSAGHAEVVFPNRGGRDKFAQWFPCAMTVDSRGRATITGDGSTAAGDALLSARLTPQGLLDRSYGRARNGRSVIQGLNASNETTCGATSAVGGNLTVGVGPVLAQLQLDALAYDRTRWKPTLTLSQCFGESTTLGSPSPMSRARRASTRRSVGSFWIARIAERPWCRAQASDSSGASSS